MPRGAKDRGRNSQPAGTVAESLAQRRSNAGLIQNSKAAEGSPRRLCLVPHTCR
jgi:hypothetical protein